ncbi:MAG TPA: hypothetical protein VFA02_05670 [Pseudacidobacterium sp.]|nr:hypothetical protein [Pseudacidobacterium sp.]
MYPVDAQETVTQAQSSAQTLLAGTDGRQLRGVWLRLIAFFLPVVLVVAPIIYWVDPFSFFAKPSPVPEHTRFGYAAPLDQALWDVLTYNRGPKPNILVGDSQTDRLPAETISQITGEPYANLATGGGSLREAISMFWFAAQRTKLRRVYFGVDFMEYSAYSSDRVPGAVAILHNPLLYFMNSTVLEAGLYDISDAVFHHKTNLGPTVNKAAFWQSQLQYVKVKINRDAYLGSLTEDLKKVVAYCQQNHISFVFIIPPQHADVRRKINELGLDGQYQNFKQSLEKLAPVYDCDVDNEFTLNEENYNDPFHLTDEAARKAARDIWSGNSQWCRILSEKQ